MPRRKPIRFTVHLLESLLDFHPLDSFTHGDSVGDSKGSDYFDFSLKKSK